MTVKETRKPQMEFWIPRGFFNYVWLANLLWNNYRVLQCQYHQSLFSEIMQIYLASFLLKDSQIFYKLWEEMFPRDIERKKKHNRKEQRALPIPQWWKLFEFRIATTYFPPLYLLGSFSGFKLNSWHCNSKLRYHKVYYMKFLYKKGEKENLKNIYHRKKNNVL